MIIYQNMFRPIMRKYVGDKGYASLDGGKTWTKSGTPESLIKKLSYYQQKVIEVAK